jgi:hypothetical protein
MRLLIRYLFILLFLYAVPNALYAQNNYQEDTDTTAVIRLLEEPTVVDTVVHIKEDNQIPTVTSKEAFDDIGSEKLVAVQQRKLNDSALNNFKQGDDFWYVNAEDKPKKPTKGFWDWLWDVTGKKWVRYGIWIFLALLFLGAVILYLKENQIGLFTERTRNISKNSEDVEAMPENIFETDFDQAIQKAIAQQNYRLSIRLLFLKTLRALAEKNLIDYGVDKTNFDYVFQLSGSSFRKEFITVTKHYEYVWYGKFEVNKEQFAIIHKGFDDLLKQLA